MLWGGKWRLAVTGNWTQDTWLVQPVLCHCTMTNQTSTSFHNPLCVLHWWYWNASVVHPAATQYVLTLFGVGWKILFIRREPMLSVFLSLNAWNSCLMLEWRHLIRCFWGEAEENESVWIAISLSFHRTHVRFVDDEYLIHLPVHISDMALQMQLHNWIIFDFYMGLPHIAVNYLGQRR